MKVEVFNNRGQSVYTACSGTIGGCFQAGGAFRVNVNRTFATDGHVETSLLSYGAPKATLSPSFVPGHRQGRAGNAARWTSVRA